MDQASEQDELNELQEVENKLKLLLFRTAKHGKLEIVKKVISRGVDVNSLDDQGNLAVEHAWANQSYDVVLLLLKSDSKFPKQLNLVHLNEGNESAQNLKKFVEERNLLHECIQQDNLKEVQKLVHKYKSKFYYNEKNNSVAYVAVKSKKFNIYAYLKSIGAEFSNDYEKEEIDRLPLKDKVALKDAMIPFFPTLADRHIHYLISKSRPQKQIEGLQTKFHDFYSKLNEIPEISTILKVIQHSDYLDIIFDFDEENVAKINPAVGDPVVGKNIKGETNYKEGRLYVAASPKRGERKILGTIAHELTHMAMQLLFENECNPYTKTDSSGQETFDRIKNKTLSTVIAEEPFKVLQNVEKEYYEKDHHGELIVTVPQILAEFENGRRWLQANASELFDFYTNTIIPECQKFVEKSVILKVKMEVKKLNETSGEIITLKKSKITFGNLDLIIDFLNTLDKNIFILRTRNTLLGMIKILQSIFGENYIKSYDEYLIFAISNETLMPQLKEIVETFYLDTCDTLVIRCMNDSFKKVLTSEFWAAIWENFQRKPNKKLIFLLDPNLEEFLLQMLQREMMWHVCAEKTDESTSLNDLEEESRNKILSKNIIFQGTKMHLKELIGTDKDLHKLITGDIIENQIEGKTVHIGEKTLNQIKLERLSNVGEEINLRTFINEFLKSDDVFITKGLNEKKLLLDCFSELIKDGLIKREKLASQVQIMGPESFEMANKRLFLTNDFSGKYFDKVCLHNRGKIMHLITVENMQNGSKFILQQVYNPSFYLERKFKIAINTDELENLISEHTDETYIFTTEDDSSNIQLKEFYQNAHVLTTKEADSKFRDFIKKQETVHWFHMKHSNELYWKNSSSSASHSWFDFTNLKTNDDCLIEEGYVIKHVAAKKGIIIADNPGMGKSTTLTKLCESSLIVQTHWVIRIDLKEHVESIKKIDSKNLSIKNIIDFLQRIKPSFNDKLTKELLESALHLNGTLARPLLLALDGFDEILDDKARDTIIVMLKYLQNNTRSKVWVTTRLHYKRILENTLSSFALQFDPIDDEDKRVYIKRYLQDRLKLIFETDLVQEVFDLKVNSKLQHYTDKFLQHMGYIFSKNASTFFGTPLQLHLMTENSVQHFKTWVEKNSVEVDFSYLGNNILRVFQNFINRKYEIYFKKQNIPEEYMRHKAKKEAEDYHKALAESLTRSTTLNKKYKNACPLMLLIGLIQANDDKNVEFIHFTFREYFAALFVIEYISNESSDFEQILRYFNEVLWKQEFKLIRNFINLLFENCDFVKIPKGNVESFRKSLILQVSQTKSEQSPEFEFSIVMRQIVCNAVLESNGKILEFILFCCEDCFTETSYADLLTMNCCENKMLLQCAISNGDEQITDLLFKKMEKISLENRKKICLQNSGSGTILEVAIRSGFCPILEFVLQKMDDVLSLNELKLLFRNILLSESKSANYNYLQTVLTLLTTNGHKCIIKVILENIKRLFPDKERKQIIMMKNAFSENILHVAARNNKNEIIEMILGKTDEMLSSEEQKKFIMMVDGTFKTILHVAAGNNKKEIIEMVLGKTDEMLSSEEQKKFIMMVDGTLKTILHVAVVGGHITLIKFLLAKIEEKLSIKEQIEFMMKNERVGGTVFHVASINGHTEIIKILFSKIDQMMSVTKQDIMKGIIMRLVNHHDTVLRLIAKNGNMELMKIWLEKCEKLLSVNERKEILMIKNRNNHFVQTILYVAAENNHMELIEMILANTNKILSIEEQKQYIMSEVISSGNTWTETVAHLAARTNNTKLMKLLLEECEKISASKELIMAENIFSENVFMVAVENADHELIKIISAKMSEIMSPKEQEEIIINHEKCDKKRPGLWPGSGKSIIYVAVQNSDNETMNMLLAMLPIEEQKKIFVAWNKRSEFDRETLIHAVARRNNIELMMPSS